MTKLAMVTRKGQVTIPVAIRRRLGIAEGGTVRFRETGDAVVIESAKPTTLTELLTGFDPDKHRHAPQDRPWDDAPRGRERL